MQVTDAHSFMQHFGVSRETADRLEIYAQTLERWQRAINLVAPATVPDMWHRHFADSAQVAALIPRPARTLVDLGAGAGFPGMVLAIMLLGPKAEDGNEAAQGLTRVILVESDTRKCAFLREVARLTGTTVDILSTRIEKRETQDSIGKVDVVTARALAPLSRLIGWAAPLMTAQSVGLFPKGKDVAAEMRAARAAYAFDAVVVPSITQADAGVVVVSGIEMQLTPAGRVEP